MSFSFEVGPGWEDTEAWLKKLAKGPSIFAQLEKYGDAGVAALRAATPIDDGETAAAWYYEVVQDKGSWSIIWGNSNIEDGRPIAVLLQHGHATRTGGYVQGRDYINPALQPIFDQMAAEGWKVVTST
jgi:hypothetical protein